MSTTRSQKRKNTQLSAEDDVSEGFVSPVEVENHSLVEQDSNVAGPSKPKSPRVENSFLESLRASLKEEITSEIKNLLAESQREMLKLLKPETRENVRINIDDETENETRSFYTPTKSVRITSTQNNDTNSSRNMGSYDVSSSEKCCLSVYKVPFRVLIRHCIIISKSCPSSPIRLSSFYGFSDTVNLCYTIFFFAKTFHSNLRCVSQTF